MFNHVLLIPTFQNILFVQPIYYGTPNNKTYENKFTIQASSLCFCQIVKEILSVDEKQDIQAHVGVITYLLHG